MNFEDILSQVLELTTRLDLRTAAILFAICFLGEGGIGIPYVLETAWLLIGYQFGRGALSPFSLFGFWLAAQIGRQLGCTTLYQLTRLGSVPFLKFYQKQRLSEVLNQKAASSRMLRSVNLLSPFSVAFGRLCALRIPLTLTLAVKKNRKTLALGVLLSSLVWDTIYLSVGGTVGSTLTLKPAQMFFLSIFAITILYLSVFIIRRLLPPKDGAAPSVPQPPVQ